MNWQIVNEMMHFGFVEAGHVFQVDVSTEGIRDGALRLGAVMIVTTLSLTRHALKNTGTYRQRQYDVNATM